MEHELIDYYDQDGNHKGIVDKCIAHKEGLWHKSVHVWIINSNNQILLQKRCRHKSFFPNFYDCSFAGHVGTGEDSINSALREGKEEIGLDLNKDDLEYLFTIKEDFKWDKIHSKEFVDVFLLRKDIDIEDLQYQKEEVESAKYFELDEVLNDNRRKDIIPHIQEYKLLKEILINKM